MDNDFNALVDKVWSSLQEIGFRRGEIAEPGPMGSQIVTFDSSLVRIDVHNDRGDCRVTAGPISGPTFVNMVWAWYFGEDWDKASTPDQQLEYFVDHFVRISSEIAQSPNIAGVLTDINWKILEARRQHRED
jgi:hypothetical protein